MKNEVLDLVCVQLLELQIQVSYLHVKPTSSIVSLLSRDYICAPN